MIILNVADLSVGKEEQDVCYDAAGGERDEGETQRPGEGQRKHLHTEQRERGQAAVIPDRKVGWWTEERKGFKRLPPSSAPQEEEETGNGLTL